MLLSMPVTCCAMQCCAASVSTHMECIDVQEREDANLSDWDRFARTEYIRLAMEEEGEDGEPESSTDLWESSVTETPF